MSQREPLMGSTPFILWKLAIQNKLRISPKYWYRFLMTSIITSFFVPVRLYEHLRYRRKILETKITQDPLFIAGHWRSGTTFMHYLLSLDGLRAYATNAEVYLPFQIFTAKKFTKRLLDAVLPEQRPMDEVKLTKELPGEEEFAIAISGGMSFYHSFMFPRKICHYSSSLTLKSCTSKEKERWKNDYYRFIQKLTLKKNGQQLLLKSPTHTGRIAYLRELFPEAKFIFLLRDPYEAYVSTTRMFAKLLPYFSFQKWSEEEVNAQLLLNMKAMWENYQQDKKQLPPESLAEVRYEALMVNAQTELEKVYEQLALPQPDDEIKKRQAQFLEEQKNFRTNKHIINRKVIQKVNAVLGEENIKAMGYPLRQL